jgi:hypothetical protein
MVPARALDPIVITGKAQRRRACFGPTYIQSVPKTMEMLVNFAGRFMVFYIRAFLVLDLSKKPLKHNFIPGIKFFFILPFY